MNIEVGKLYGFNVNNEISSSSVSFAIVVEVLAIQNDASSISKIAVMCKDVIDGEKIKCDPKLLTPIPLCYNMYNFIKNDQSKNDFNSQLTLLRLKTVLAVVLTLFRNIKIEEGSIHDG